MALSNIWIVTEPSNGSFTTTSLELLTEARTLGGVSRPSRGVATPRSPLSLVSTARRRCMTSATWPARYRARPSPRPLRRSWAPWVRRRDPDPTSYDGRDVAGRLSARLDRPVLTNVTGLRDDGGLVTEHPIFGGTQTVRAASPARVPASVSSARSPSPPKRAAARPRRSPRPCGRRRCYRYRDDRRHTRRRASGAEIGRGRGRGLRRARTR